MNVLTNEFAVHSLINDEHLRCCVHDLLLLEKNIRCGCSILFCFFKNVFRKVNTSLACYMNIQKYVRSLLIDGLMDVHDLHSYVLLFLCLNYLLHPALCS